MEAFSRSLQFDYRLAQADIRGTKAYVGELQRLQILTRQEAETILKSLNAIASEAAAKGEQYFAGAAEEDIHTFLLGKLRERAGEVADKVHTGRSRNEQVTLDFRLWLKDAIGASQFALKSLLGALLQMAESHSSVVLPGYTHLRRAQPLLWPHYLLAYFEMFVRDYQRLVRCFESADVLPLGSGALAGGGLPVDRKKLAKELGFSRISRNSLDAVSDRDFALEFLFAASLCFLHLSRLAEDWILYSSEEFGFLEMGDEVSTGSSLMPQKKNPDSLELIRGKTGRVVGHLVSLATTLKAQPLAYNRDLQEDKEPVFDAAGQLEPALRLAAQVVETTTLRPEAMQKASAEGWLCATDLAEFLATKGVAFHQAHEIVGKLVLDSVRAGKQSENCSLEELKRYSPAFDEKALPLLTPGACIARRAVPGGTAPSCVTEALEEARAWLKAT